MKRFLIFILLMGCAKTFAGIQTGKVKEILVRDDGLHYFYLDGVATEKPACARNAYWMIKDENSVAGKSQLSILLTAQASGKSIFVIGKNSCIRWSDGEDVMQISIQY